MIISVFILFDQIFYCTLSILVSVHPATALSGYFRQLTVIKGENKKEKSQKGFVVVKADQIAD